MHAIAFVCACQVSIASVSAPSSSPPIASEVAAQSLLTLPPAPANGGASALSALVRGPFDVQTSTGDNLCLGVEHAWGYFWVTATNNGGAKRIHQFDLAGNYLQSFYQSTNSSGFGGRDLAADSANFDLYVGSDNGEISQYHFVPNWGAYGYLYPVAIHNLPLALTVRGLAHDPLTGHFFVGDFTSGVYEVELPSTIHGQWPLPGTTPYGYAFDWLDRTLWLWAQDADPSNTQNFAHALEWDVAAHAFTGREFYGAMLGSTQSAGGADIYTEPSTGELALITLHQTTLDAIAAYDVSYSTTPSPTSYCTAKVSSLGCVPTMTTSDPSSAPSAGADDYDVVVTNVNSLKNGLIFFGYGAANNAPFQGGTLCMTVPVQRTPVQSSGGFGPNDCTGSLSLRINAPFDPRFLEGDEVRFQGWFRDPPAVSATGLSDALLVTIGGAVGQFTCGLWEVGSNGFKKLPAPPPPQASQYKVTIHNDGPSDIKVFIVNAEGVTVVIHPIAAGAEKSITFDDGQRVVVHDGTDDGEGASGWFCWS